MRKLLAALFVLLAWPACAQPLVGPVPEPITFSAATYTEATKPAVLPSQAGNIAYISNCQNSNQTLPGTGCLSFVNTSGAWVDMPSPPTAAITFGGQTLYLGQNAGVNGNGTKIQLFGAGSTTTGHIAVFDASGNVIDGGGFASGGGTVSSSSNANVLAYYSAAGTTVVPLSSTANAVVSTNGSNAIQISKTLPTGLTIGGETLTLLNYTTATLPAVSGSNTGQLVWNSNCYNGTEFSNAGSGCIYAVNNAGQWVSVNTIPTGRITVGGQALALGQSSANQGNGGLLQLSTGSFTSGHCVQFDVNGNTVDAGGACTTGGGGGTVTSSPINSIPYYSGTGTVVVGLSTTNNAVLVTNGSGVPSESATLPSGLSIPAPSMSSPNMSGTAAAVNLTSTGLIITNPSTTGSAGLRIGPGVAPTSPVNGDTWTTSAAGFMRINGATQGIATTTNGGALSGTSPVAVSAAGAISCTTCLTATGGALTATTPLVLTGNALTIASTVGVQLGPLNFDSITTVHNDTYYFSTGWQWATGKIISFTASASGTSASYVLTININGSPVTGCSTITVNSSSLTTTTCTVGSTQNITTGQTITAVITSATNSPSPAFIQLNATRSPI